MENTSENKAANGLNHINIGILAHVDAGKTTLSESILYLTGSIRKLGRVDHQDAFLDTYEMERARGITIFSKQAQFILGDKEATLLDTPGHVDFSAEMERTLQVLDYAVLVISGADGVQAHVETLWRLLKRYHIPTFLFINKMDQQGTDRKALMEELTRRLDGRCIDFDEHQDLETFYENIAVCDEAALEMYLENGQISTKMIQTMIAERKVFPCYFGSALKMDGVEAFLKGLDMYTACPAWPDDFGARVYKIARDDKGTRLTYMKITGGCLKVKMTLTNRNGDMQPSEDVWEEKADQIRIYSGASYKTVNEAPAGAICAVTGLTKTYSGQGLGKEQGGQLPVLEPVLTYRIALPEQVNVHDMYTKLRQLEEEIPELHIVWQENGGEIHAQVMGEVQIEILQNMIKERFGTDVRFDSGSIVYKETIKNSVEGVGHFEPLRHYAEVHLLMEPGEPNTGLVFDTAVSEDMLDKNWQRLILTHLEEKRHVGVLTGSEITDMKITLVAGRAHQKHTEGGDFRQATYRAVRHGLKCAESVLLEPVYQFRLEIPTENVGRAIADVQKMNGEFSPPESKGEFSVLTGTAPAALMRDYQREVTAYTKGRGRIAIGFYGYAPCRNAEEVIEQIGYDSEKDTENPTGSVFCAHGAGFIVPWYEVKDYMHLEGLSKEKPEEEQPVRPFPKHVETSGWADDKELEEIFTRTYGPVKREFHKSNRPAVQRTQAPERKPKKENDPNEKEYLLVDGYNIIFAWEELKALAADNIDSARTKLMDVLCNYQGFKNNILILVFDAYRVEGHPGEISRYKNIFVVYTKEAETADMYIEKTVHEIGRKHKVTVATSDALEQVIILGQGAKRISARGLLDEIEAAGRQMHRDFLGRESRGGQYLLQNLDRETAQFIEDVRLGQKKFDKH